ncbi:head maturation protease, ClpP-related [Nocardia nova]
MNARDRIRALAGEHAGRSWYRINAAAEDNSAAEILIYDEIDSWFGVSAEQFVRDLAALDAEQVNLRINSPGGNVYDGLAIMNAIAGHPATVTAYVDGLAASAASFIAVAADEVVMRPGSELMIHDAWGLTIGNAADMAAMAEQLDRTSGTLAQLYADKTGGTADEMRALMRAETWFSADEAVDAGLADRVEKPAKDKASAAAAKARAFDLTRFAYAGRAAAPAPRLHKSPSARARAEVTPGKEGTMPDLIEGLRGVLGLPEDADEAAVLAAVTERVDSVENATTDEPAAPTIQQIAASAKALNLTLVDTDQYAALTRQAEQGAQAFAKMQADRKAAVLDEAIRTGRISKAQTEIYTKQLDRDLDGTEAFLMSLPKNVAVPVDELGHAGEPEVDEFEANSRDIFARITGRDWKGSDQ